MIITTNITTEKGIEVFFDGQKLNKKELKIFAEYSQIEFENIQAISEREKQADAKISLIMQSLKKRLKAKKHGG